jgi:hypothetical protein
MNSRRFHCYCVGAAKTGTTSIAKAFAQQYKSAHEPDLERVFRIIRKSSLEENLINSMLKTRDEELQLEMESSHPIIFLIPNLVKLFSEAKFIITIREPRDWLSSRLDFHYKKRFIQKERISYPRSLLRKTKEKATHFFGGPIGSWKDYNDRLESNHLMDYSKFDVFLRQFNVSPIDFYLAEYASHYRTLFKSIPSQRRLIVDLDSLVILTNALQLTVAGITTWINKCVSFFYNLN